MNELASVSVGAVLFFLEALTHLGFVILVSVFPSLEFMNSMGKRTFVPKFTLGGKEVFTHFSFILDSKVTIKGVAFFSLLVAQMSSRCRLHLTVVVCFNFTVPVVCLFFEGIGIPGRTRCLIQLTLFDFFSGFI